ncbi:MAG TPA: hypothetical protein VK324_13030, partial [Tepidisphaeraceae bacterium]|nr:hypothetical protein [Tepidisphaeraceae bacterium]
MPAETVYQVVQVVYWLALSTWFGGALFIAMAAPVVLRTVGAMNPVLPEVLSVNLEGQHGTLLAGSIVGDLIARLAQVQVVCAAALLVAMIGQWFVIDTTHAADLLRSNRVAAALRLVLLLAAAAVVLYDWRVLWPRIHAARQQYLDHADEPEVANAAKDQFDHEHRRSVTLLAVVVGLLLGV